MAIYNYDTTAKRVGKNLKLYDGTSWATGSDLTQTDVKEIVNEVYREDLFQLISSKYPEYYRQVAYADSWIATGTVSASSTGATLVASTAIFTNSMVGLIVYNSTEDETAEITAYTSTTTVTLDTTINDTWDGDTIYILGQEFGIGGDATDIYEVETIGVKYSSSDDYYRIVDFPRTKHDAIQYGGERFSKIMPAGYMTTLQVSSVLTDAIGILPQFDAKVSNAIELNYIGKPVALSADADVPRLPSSLPLIYGATARGFEQRYMFKEAGYYEEKFQREKISMISQFKLLASADTFKPKVPRRFGAMHKRRI